MNYQNNIIQNMNNQKPNIEKEKKTGNSWQILRLENYKKCHVKQKTCLNKYKI